LKMLECNRNEDDARFPDEIAKKYAQELYQAGAARTIGFEPEPFIRILANVNIKQFESINDFYPSKQLIKDIQSKLGGDFQLAVLTRCTNKYDYLANRIETALKGFSPDKESLCRILGCLSRPDCVRVKLAYNRLGFKRTLDEALRSVLKGQTNYLNACLMLISEDMTMTPLGTDKELQEEEVEIGREAERLVDADIANQYNRTTMIEKGEAIMAAKRKLNKKKKGLFSVGGSSSTNNNEDKDKDKADGENKDTNSPTTPEDEEEDDPSSIVDPIIAEEDRILSFTWDGKGRFMDANKLTATYRELEYCENQVSLYLDRLEVEINELKGVYKTIFKLRVETDAYLRVYQNHIRALSDFQLNRETLVANNKSKKY